MDPEHHENRGLREAMQRRIPLIYLHGIEKGLYIAAWPIYVVGDDRYSLTFIVDLDGRSLSVGAGEAVADSELQRRYFQVTTLRRVHQEEFRRRVLRAYHESCALCRLRRRELLDAAHITPDSDPHGDAAVSNALSLCKLHHAAFDQQLIGVRPDLVVEVRADVLAESDGPMLVHGLQQMHGLRLIVPKQESQRPDRDRLEVRYQLFREAG
jgi:putative restriction endonuclease